MSLHAVNIQGINITDSPKKDILKEVQEYLFSPTENSQKKVKNSPKPLFIVTPNPEQIVYAKKDRHFTELLNLADVALPDGIGLVWASRFLAKNHQKAANRPIASPIPGVDFMEELLEISANRHVPIALIGGRSGVAVSTFECLRQKHPDLVGVAMDAPEFVLVGQTLTLKQGYGIMHATVFSTGTSEVDREYSSQKEYMELVASFLKANSAGIVFVALGAPKQEYFIEKLIMSFRPSSRNPEEKKRIPGQSWDDTTRIVLMSVGGSFDELAGRVKRAPKWVSGIGLKWLWRLCLEPWRIKRQRSLLTFVKLILQDRYILK